MEVNEQNEQTASTPEGFEQPKPWMNVLVIVGIIIFVTIIFYGFTIAPVQR